MNAEHRYQKMRRWKPWIRYTVIAGVSSVILASLVPSQSASAAADPFAAARDAWQAIDGRWSFDQQVAYQRHFRSQFDYLEGSDAEIANAMATGNSNGSFERFGLRLTDAELSEAQRREEMQAVFPALTEAATGSPLLEETVEGLDSVGSTGSLAGQWIDQHNGGRLTIALAIGHPDRNLAAARVELAKQNLINAGRIESADVAVVDARFTLDELRNVNRDFGAEFLAEGRSIAMSASINEVDNRVDLFAERSFVGAAMEFASRYPEGLVVVQEMEPGSLEINQELLPRDDWGAGFWHAGAAIYVTKKNSGGTTILQDECTWGATVRTVSYLYVVTAAHCLGYGLGSGRAFWWNDQVGNSQKKGVQMIGAPDIISNINAHTYVGFYHGSRGDIARLMISHFNNADLDVECYLANYGHCNRKMTGRELTTQTYVGEIKCASLGKTETWQCGTLISNDASASGYDFLRQIDLACGQSQLGDSGAGWIEQYGTLYTGIHAGSLPWPRCDAVATHAYYVTADAYLDANEFCGTSGICGNPPN